MTRPILVVDFDDVCVDFVGGYLQFHNKYYFTKVSYEQVYTYDLHKLFKISVEEKNRRIAEYWASPEHDYIQPMQDAAASLWILAERYEIHMASARASNTEAQTKRLIDRYFPELFERVHLLGSFHHAEGKRRTKAEICDEVDAVALIDDAFHNAEPAVKEGRKVLMPDRPWNWDRNHAGVIRVFGWSQILAELGG